MKKKTSGLNYLVMPGSVSATSTFDFALPPEYKIIKLVG
jgi:hypothetical protein